MVIIINRLTFSHFIFICKFSIHMALSTHLGISLALMNVHHEPAMNVSIYEMPSLPPRYFPPSTSSPHPLFLAVPLNLQDLTSLTRHWIQPRPPEWKHQDLTPGPAGNSPPSISLHSHNQNLPNWLQDLSSLTSAMKACSPNHWSTREFCRKFPKDKFLGSTLRSAQSVKLEWDPEVDKSFASLRKRAIMLTDCQRLWTL